MLLQALPAALRPREKLLRHGPECLADEELLALVLRTGRPGQDVLSFASELLQKVKLALLRELGDPEATYQVGDVVQFPTPDGQASYAGVVREVGPPQEGWLLFDFNHPLAGQALRFEVQVIGAL